MPSRHDTGWDRVYHRRSPRSLPWELGKPRRALVELVDSGLVTPSKTLDLCCGAGTNPVYLAERGFDVTTLDVSDKAVGYAREKAQEAGVELRFLVGDFSRLPFRTAQFDFAFDFGCFHHVHLQDRTTFIKGVHRVLKPRGIYFLVCFSHRNGSAWNHFKRGQIVELFQGFFEIERIKHVSSLEGDGVVRYFYEVMMKRMVKQLNK